METQEFVFNVPPKTPLILADTSKAIKRRNNSPPGSAKRGSTGKWDTVHFLDRCQSTGYPFPFTNEKHDKNESY